MDKSDKFLLKKVEKSLRKGGLDGWLLLGSVPPGSLVFTRSKSATEKVAISILKSLKEDPILREMFRCMLAEIDGGLIGTPPRGGMA
jgi:hypothetical protein